MTERGMYVSWAYYGAPMRVLRVNSAAGLISVRHVHGWDWLERTHAALEDGWWRLTGQRYVRRPVRR